MKLFGEKTWCFFLCLLHFRWEEFIGVCCGCCGAGCMDSWSEAGCWQVMVQLPVISAHPAAGVHTSSQMFFYRDSRWVKRKLIFSSESQLLVFFLSSSAWNSVNLQVCLAWMHVLSLFTLSSSSLFSAPSSPVHDFSSFPSTIQFSSTKQRKKRNKTGCERHDEEKSVEEKNEQKMLGIKQRGEIKE